MKLKIARLKRDDDAFGFKAGDLILIDWDYDWDGEKVVGLFRLPPGKDILKNSFYKSQLEFLTTEEVDNFCL